MSNPTSHSSAVELIPIFLGVLSALGGSIIVLVSLGVLAVQLLFSFLLASWRLISDSLGALAVQ